MLFLHGGSQTAHMWDFCALALRDRYHCIALDQRGHGDSDWAPDGEYSLEKHQGDIEGFIREVGIAPFNLVGLSMGGQNSTVLTANNPDWVKKVVIIDVGPEVQSEGIQEIRSFTSLPDELDSFEEFGERVAVYSHHRPIEQIRSSLKHNVKQFLHGRDLNATIDARSIYASAMSTVFDLDFKRIQKEVFWGEKLENLSDKLFS